MGEPEGEEGVEGEEGEERERIGKGEGEERERMLEHWRKMGQNGKKMAQVDTTQSGRI
jgi:hypothetical protein